MKKGILLAVAALILTGCSITNWHASYNREHVVVCELYQENVQLLTEIGILEHRLYLAAGDLNWKPPKVLPVPKSCQV